MANKFSLGWTLVLGLATGAAAQVAAVPYASDPNVLMPLSSRPNPLDPFSAHTNHLIYIGPDRRGIIDPVADLMDHRPFDYPIFAPAG
jgi:hypothetical protein